MKTIIPHPPLLKSLAPQFNFRIRYQVSTPLEGHSIIVGDLLDSLCFAVTPTAAYRILNAIRIKSITMWGPMGSDLVPQPVAIVWLSNNSALFAAPAKIISDTSMGASECAYLNTSPPRGSLASNWFQTTCTQTTQLFEIGCPANTIIDVMFEGVYSFQGVPYANFTAISGASDGQVFVNALDPSGMSVIVPQIVATP